MEKGSGTRSGLLWEVERLLNECTELPQVLLMENVPQVHSVKNKEHFDKWIAFLESKGYSNHWQDLNAKDYGIPQSRNRCYMVSILGEHSFEFPKSIPLELRLGDLLEPEVDEKYYLSDAAIQGRTNSSFRQYNLERSLINEKEVHPTILARYEGSPTLLDETLKREVCNKAIEQNLVTPYDIIDPSYSNSRLREIENGEIKTVNSENNQIANTLTTSASNFGICVPAPVGEHNQRSKLLDEIESSGILNGDINEPKIIQKFGDRGTSQFSIRDYAHTIPANPMSDRGQMVVEPKVVGGIGEKKSNGGRQWYQQDRVYDDGCAISVTTAFNPYYATEKRIRKLTPKECWRLMGFADEDVEKAAEVCSNSQLYKQAGNSIVVNVLMAIFGELFVPKKTRSQWLDDLLNN